MTSDHKPDRLARHPRLAELSPEELARVIVAEYLLSIGDMAMDEAVAYARAGLKSS